MDQNEKEFEENKKRAFKEIEEISRHNNSILMQFAMKKRYIRAERHGFTRVWAYHHRTNVYTRFKRRAGTGREAKNYRLCKISYDETRANSMQYPLLPWEIVERNILSRKTKRKL